MWGQYMPLGQKARKRVGFTDAFSPGWVIGESPVTRVLIQSDDLSVCCTCQDCTWRGDGVG